jgi:hypothetical protein
MWGTAVGWGFIGGLPMVAWMLLLAFVNVEQVWQITGTALALIYSLALLAAVVISDSVS